MHALMSPPPNVIWGPPAGHNDNLVGKKYRYHDAAASTLGTVNIKLSHVFVRHPLSNQLFPLIPLQSSTVSLVSGENRHFSSSCLNDMQPYSVLHHQKLFMTLQTLAYYPAPRSNTANI